MSKRINELDFLKCVLIIFMVMFHLVCFGDKYPELKRLVYTFHMPGFLLISGYLTNRIKTPQKFTISLRYMAVPYLIMESCYIIMASILPIREHIDTLNISLFFSRLLLHPIGPYWFIHTLILCEIVYYTSFKLVNIARKLHKTDSDLEDKNNFKNENYIGILLTGSLFLILSQSAIGLLSFSNAIYYLIGATLKVFNINILKVFYNHSSIIILPLILLTYDSTNYERTTINGLLIVYCSLSTLLYIYNKITTPNFFLYIGRHTFIILLFSPIFTMLSKFFIPLFSFDSTIILFMIFAVIFVLSGSFVFAYILDLTKISDIIYGKKFLNNKTNS